MTTPTEEWQALSNAFTAFRRKLGKTESVNLNSTKLRAEAKELAQQYFRRARACLLDSGQSSHVDALDSAFRRLIVLSNGANATSSYKKQATVIARIIPVVMGGLELGHSAVTLTAKPSDEDVRIIKTLEGLVPAAALSFRQAIIDLADESRVSFRGPASELREALRGTLDHLAPDKDVTSADGYKQEEGTKGPTMKQKVRFILKSRGQSKSVSELPEQTASTIDEMVGTLTRSVYERSSIATHVALERKAVVQIRRYVVAVLHHILEI
jgi:hypothetical protein